jgi:hypothetical protein
VDWKKLIFENFNISENNIISVELANQETKVITKVVEKIIKKFCTSYFS